MESFGDGTPPVTSDTMRLVTINVDGMFNADGTRNFKGRSSKDRIDLRQSSMHATRLQLTVHPDTGPRDTNTSASHVHA